MKVKEGKRARVKERGLDAVINQKRSSDTVT